MNSSSGSSLSKWGDCKSISGDLVATAVGQMLSAMTDVDGSAGYVAIERVDGVLAGRKGTLEFSIIIVGGKHSYEFRCTLP